MADLPLEQHDRRGTGHAAEAEIAGEPVTVESTYDGKGADDAGPTWT